jgi:hypothetical protein
MLPGWTTDIPKNSVQSTEEEEDFFNSYLAHSKVTSINITDLWAQHVELHR